MLKIWLSFWTFLISICFKFYAYKKGVFIFCCIRYILIADKIVILFLQIQGFCLKFVSEKCKIEQILT